MITIEVLITRLKIYKEKVQDTLSEDDDLLLSAVLVVLETIRDEGQEDDLLLAIVSNIMKILKWD